MKITSNIDPVNEFEYELGCIKNDFYYDMAVKMIFKLPDYYFFVPASSSGKYHPRSDMGIGGLRRHGRAVFIVGEELLKHPTIGGQFTDDEKDEIRIALMGHDGVKQGIDDEPLNTTVPTHPLLVRNALAPWDNGTDVPDEVFFAWDRICTMIESHMGPWNTDKETKEVILQVPNTEAQKFVHLCDFIASREAIEVNVFKRQEQSGYKKPEVNTDWRNEPAKDTQIFYLTKLYTKCGEAGIAVDPVKVTDETGKTILLKGEASDLIQNLKDKLGIK